MSSNIKNRRGKPEEPDWRTRENRGHTWFTGMKKEKDKKQIATKYCQRCNSHDHFTYECKNERIYPVRPSMTQQLKHPNLIPTLTLETPPDLLEKQKKEREAAIKNAELLTGVVKKDNPENAESCSSYSYSGSDYSDSESYSYSYSYSDDEKDGNQKEKKAENGNKEEKKETIVDTCEKKISTKIAFNIVNGEKSPEAKRPLKLLKKKDDKKDDKESNSDSYSYSYSYSDSATGEKDKKKNSKRDREDSDHKEKKRIRYSSSSEYSD